MTASPDDRFYDDLAAYYHLMFEDWPLSIERQAGLLAGCLPPATAKGPVLDCACGIGTQALGLAARGFEVEASDLSPPAIARARAEAASRRLDIEFRVDDMRTLTASPMGRFGAVLAIDNALPHLDSDAEVRQALASMFARLRPGGTLLLSLRDYAPLISARPTLQETRVFGQAGQRRRVHQRWHWTDERRYVLHLHIATEDLGGHWTDRHFVGRYRALTPAELVERVEDTGYGQAEILMPGVTGFYQPLVRATRP